LQNITRHLSRREWVKLAGMSAAAAATGGRIADGAPPAAISLFDGKTLDGWLQIENNATSLSSAAINDPAAFAAKLTTGTDAVSIFLRAHLQDLAGRHLHTNVTGNPYVRNTSTLVWINPATFVASLGTFGSAGYTACERRASLTWTRMRSDLSQSGNAKSFSCVLSSSTH
jgi:hypothetical protein